LKCDHGGEREKRIECRRKCTEFVAWKLSMQAVRQKKKEDKDFKSEYIILKNKIKTKQCSIEYAQGYLYCLINMCVNDDNLYDEYSRAIDDIGEVIICGK